MITEDYVSFETAKLLKEKGFDEKCKYVWKLDKANDPQATDRISKICAERFMEGESFVDNSDIKSVFEYEGWLEDYHEAYLCPTLQMAKKWLRKAYDIHINVFRYPAAFFNDNNEQCKPWWFQYTLLKPLNEIDIDSHMGDDEFESPEEAMDCAIKYCLKNLLGNEN